MCPVVASFVLAPHAPHWIVLHCAQSFFWRETGEKSETGQASPKLNSSPASALSEAAGVISTVRIERPLLHREGSASTTINGPFMRARFSLQRAAWLILDCARRTSTASSCAFREQEGRSGGSCPILPSLLAFPLLEGHPCWSRCGRRTRPFPGRAFREHRINAVVVPIS